MMYFLHHLSDRFIGFNVFLYVTFRAIAAAVTAFLLTLIFGNFIIRILIALKLGQPIRGAARFTASPNCTAASKERRPWVACWLLAPSLCPVLSGRALITASFGWSRFAWFISVLSGSLMIISR